MIRIYPTQAVGSSTYIGPKTFKGSDDELEVKHAWKNGVWHCLQPVSFDLSDSENIHEKAYRWLGHLTAVHDVSDPFKMYFLVGRPQGRKLEKAFNSAVKILRKAPVNTEIFFESQVTALSNELEQQVRSHRSPHAGSSCRRWPAAR